MLSAVRSIDHARNEQDHEWLQDENRGGHVETKPCAALFCLINFEILSQGGVASTFPMGVLHNIQRQREKAFSFTFIWRRHDCNFVNISRD